MTLNIFFLLSFHLLFFKAWEKSSPPSLSDVKFRNICFHWNIYILISSNERQSQLFGLRELKLPIKKKIMKTSVPLNVWTVADFTVCNACLEALDQFSELCITEHDSSSEIKQLLPSQV